MFGFILGLILGAAAAKYGPALVAKYRGKQP